MAPEGALNIADEKSGDDAVKRILAITAVVFLLLRPVCDVWAAAHGHAGSGTSAHAAAVVADGHGVERHSSEFCCSNIQDGNLISPAGVFVASSATDGWFLGSTAGITVGRRHQLQPRVWHRLDAPLAQLSYYARSARILR